MNNAGHAQWRPATSQQHQNNSYESVHSECVLNEMNRLVVELKLPVGALPSLSLVAKGNLRKLNIWAKE